MAASWLPLWQFTSFSVFLSYTLIILVLISTDVEAKVLSIWSHYCFVAMLLCYAFFSADDSSIGRFSPLYPWINRHTYKHVHGWLCFLVLLLSLWNDSFLCVPVSVLQAVRRKLIDTQGNLNNWKKSDPCTSNWTGVACILDKNDGYFHVRELYADFILSYL